ncbi:hypothetical protein SAMN05892883_0764 [Jatrophihabitans sp. GAS493]|uniref:hypothetical protein n=1 Tax=Jatrophihabitans sp. GAS493 TaxID=1907575 RepID=UPI000BB6BB0F|nr:hypothetical protein [Jatrophihabitans sp. GAS493]SOD71200.1 hypothetical protein SAMN05892883_0764 [Jatrophihabitans sp. GAS493]
MGTSAWYSDYEQYEVIDALHEAGHALAAKLLGAASVAISLTPWDYEIRGTTSFNFDPSSTELAPADYEIDLPGAPPATFTRLTAELDIPTRTWIVTRSGGVASLIGCHSLDFEVDEARVMADCEHDDRALDKMPQSSSPVVVQQWIEQRYRETWALLVLHETAILSVARCALGHDNEGVQAALSTARGTGSGTFPLISDAALARGDSYASDIGFSCWPDWRAHERLRVEAIKKFICGPDGPFEQADAKLGSSEPGEHSGANSKGDVPPIAR